MYEKELEIAKDATLKAGELIKELFERKVKSEKGKDIKLEADMLSEQRIIEILLSEKECAYDILSEEKGFIKGKKNTHTWIIDPLDGSANYSRGMDELCCVSVALWKNDQSGHPKEPVLGIINRFKTYEFYSGIVGARAWKNDIPIKSSEVLEVGKAILATGFPVLRDYTSESLKEFIMDIQQFKKIRMLGSAAIMGALVAEGKIDAYMEEGIMLWDVAASTAIALASGAVVDDIKLSNDTDYRVNCHIFANRMLKKEYERNIKH